MCTIPSKLSAKNLSKKISNLRMPRHKNKFRRSVTFKVCDVEMNELDNNEII
jgi:hypothetical protein